MWGRWIKVRRVGGSLCVTIPKCMAKYFGWEEGNLVKLDRIDREKIVFIKVFDVKLQEKVAKELELIKVNMGK